ncbi:MAG: heme-binding domain-containing protein [Acidobacteria bacterium]|nr:heme-binding domain-containing protein [Acidobacteriota bacterium]
MIARIVRWCGGLLVALLACAQLIRVERSNPASDPARSIHARTQMTPRVAEILDRACRDCHSNTTRWPWYSHVAPASWLVTNHVNHGRRHLNFSTWDARTAHGGWKGPAEKLDQICEEVSGGAMPLASYTLIHRSARLSPYDAQVLCEWAKAESGRMRSVAAVSR